MSAPAPGPRPLRRDAERNRRRILDAAREVFADRGLVVTLDDIAHHAGLGVGTVYRRFADRDALVEALFEERIRKLVELADRAARDEDPWESLVGFLEASSEEMAADRGLRETLLSTRHGQAGVALARAQLVPRVAGLIERAQRSGQLRPGVAPSDLVTVLEAVQAAAEIGGARHDGHWRRLFAVLVDGLRAGPGTRGALPGAALTEEELNTAMDSRRRVRRG